MDHSKGTAKHELADLGSSESTLENTRYRDLEGRDGVVKIHDRVNERVEDDKNPNRR